MTVTTKSMIVVPRTGNAPLRFDGSTLSSATSRTSIGPGRNRWYELTLYSITGGFVVSLSFCSKYHGEHSQDFAAHCADAQEIIEFLRSFDPCNPCVWVGPEWRDVKDGGDSATQHRTASERNEYVRRAIRTGYESAVSELIQGAGEEFHERII